MIDLNCEKTIRFITKNLPISDETTRKSVLFHGIRVGMYLYENGYNEDIVLAGFLHDVLEFSDVDESDLIKEYGKNITKIVKACSKDSEIENKIESDDDVIKRCFETGQDALIVKAGDVLDSLKYYQKQNNHEQLDYCQRNINLHYFFNSSNILSSNSCGLYLKIEFILR
jgi:(p)ppGpp synthase/HD superfamily hydrolase